MRAIATTVALVASSVVACAGPTVTAPSSSPSVKPAPAASPRAVAVAEPAASVLPHPSEDLLLPTGDGVVVFEVERMRHFDIRPLARAFVLGVVEVDLLELQKRCGFALVDVTRRLIVSGSTSGGVLAAIEPVDVTSSAVMECLARAFPHAQARELLGQPVLELGHEQLWVTERNGAVLVAQRGPLVEALGGEAAVPPMIDGVPMAPPRSGDVNDALALLSRDPNRLIAVGHRGGGGAFLPTLSITFDFDGDAIGVEGDIDLSDEPGPEDLDRIKRKLSREIVREVERVTGSPSAAGPLLRAVDEARLEQRDRHLIFSGRTAALDVFAQLVNGVARQEIERELRRRDGLPPAETEVAPIQAPVEAAAEPVDVSRDR